MECPRIYNEIIVETETMSYDVAKNTRKFGKMFRVAVGVPRTLPAGMLTEPLGEPLPIAIGIAHTVQPPSGLTALYHRYLESQA